MSPLRKQFTIAAVLFGLVTAWFVLTAPVQAHAAPVLTIVNKASSQKSIRLSSNLKEIDGRVLNPGQQGVCANGGGKCRVYLSHEGVGSYKIGLDGKGYGPCHKVSWRTEGVFSDPPNDPPNGRVIYRTWFGYDCV